MLGSSNWRRPKLATLKELAGKGELKLTDLIQREGMTKWVSAIGVKGLFEQVTAKSPPILVAVPAAQEPITVLHLAQRQGSSKKKWRPLLVLSLTGGGIAFVVLLLVCGGIGRRPRLSAFN